MNRHTITYLAVKQVLRDYWLQYKKHPLYTILAFLSPAIGSIMVSLIPPLIVAHIINEFAKNGISLQAAWPSVLLFGLLWFVGEGFWRVGMHYLIKLEAEAIPILGKISFNRLSARDYDFYTNNFVGTLTKTAMAFMRGFETFSDTLCFSVINNVIPAIFAFAILAWYSPWLSVILVVCLAIAIGIGLPIVHRRSRLVAERHIASSKVSGRLSDSLTNIMAVKSFAREESETETFMVLLNDFKSKYVRAANFQNLRFDVAISPVYVLTNVIGLAAAVYFSERLGLQVGTIFVVFAYYAQVTRVFWDTNRVYRNIETSIGEAAEFTQLFIDPPAVRDVSGASPLSVYTPTIHFDNIRFGYGNSAVSEVNADEGKSEEVPAFLDNFKLDIKANQKVGLVGPSGGGKTTITKLLLRFIDVQSGRITIDGQDISKVTQSSLRDAIAYVPQEPLLFHRSLLENISYGNPGASPEDVIHVSKIAHAHEFISELPSGYDTLVGERGIKLSGGQRQRVAIARALLKQAPILVLDEATSSLDSESEKYIQDGLRELMKNKTALVIAHRLSTIKHLDRIVVIDDGHIVQDGTHEELIAKRGLYATLWKHQSGEFLEG